MLTQAEMLVAWDKTFEWQPSEPLTCVAVDEDGVCRFAFPAYCFALTVDEQGNATDFRWLSHDAILCPEAKFVIVTGVEAKEES